MKTKLILLILFFAVFIHAETTWTTGAYSNNEDRREELSIPNATKLIVNVKGETERWFDFFMVYNNRGRIIKILHGKIDQTFTVNGSAITARLKSDFSITKSGVTIHIKDDNGGNTDTQKPVITLIGNDTITLTVGDTYTDAGATATDNVDGNITSRITVNNTVNTSTAGTYTVTYAVSDTAGNSADVVTRTVVVNNQTTDTQKPVITLIGNDTITLTVGDTYTDAGATATDNVDGNITSHITVNNTVNTSTAGTYTVTYNVSDMAGNSADVVTRTVVVERDKVYAFFADEHNDQNNSSTGTGTGNRVIQVDLETMSIVNTLNVPGILGHHADNTYNSKLYAVPKGSNFINVVPLNRNTNNTITMRNTKQIPLTFKPRSADAYNSKYNIVFLTASNRPMGAFINVATDEVVGTIGEETDCTLTDGTQLLSHPDANTAEGALKYQCALDTQEHGGEQISGHPYWLTDDIAAIVDRSNKQISTYRVRQVGTRIEATLMNRVATRTSVHQIVPRDRTNLPASQQMDFYAVEEGVERVSANDYSGGVPHALIHLRLTNNGLRLERRMNLQRTEVLPKVKADRILNACVTIYRSTFGSALNGPSQEREDRYNALFAQEGITRSPDQDIYNDFPVDCFYPGIPGGHNADFAPNNKHLYIGMAGGAMSVVDVNRWKIANNIDIGIGTGPGHMCFSEKNDVALSSNHGFSDTFGNRAITRSIRYINSERPIGYYWIKIPFARENITNTAISHSCYVDESGDNYYNFFTDGGVFYKIDLSQVFNNPTNGGSDLVVDSVHTGGIPIQGSFIHSNTIHKGN